MIELTPQEYKVVSLVAEGYTDKQIGEALFISATTVKTHVRNIRRKSLHPNKITMAIAFIRGEFQLKAKEENPMYLRILNLVNKGLTLKQIAETVGLDYTATYNYLRRSKLKFPELNINLPLNK